MVPSALDRETGEPVWEVPILGTYAAQIYNINPLTDGTTVVLQISTFTDDSGATPARFSSPALTTVALDAGDGRLLWERESTIDSMEVRSGPVLVDGLFLAYGLGGAADGNRTLTALRAADGTEVWQSDVIPGQSAWWSAGDNYALSTDANGALIAIDLTTGEEAWRVSMPPLQNAPPSLITEDAIVVAGEDGRIVVWRTAAAPASTPAANDPAGRPLVARPSPDATLAGPPATPDPGSSGRSALARGSWTFDWAVPAIADGRVFDFGTAYLQASTERSIIALDLENGQGLWRPRSTASEPSSLARRSRLGRRSTSKTAPESSGRSTSPAAHCAGIRSVRSSAPAIRTANVSSIRPYRLRTTTTSPLRKLTASSTCSI